MSRGNKLNALERRFMSSARGLLFPDDDVGEAEDERPEDGADESEGRQHWAQDQAV